MCLQSGGRRSAGPSDHHGRRHLQSWGRSAGPSNHHGQDGPASGAERGRVPQTCCSKADLEAQIHTGDLCPGSLLGPFPKTAQGTCGNGAVAPPWPRACGPEAGPCRRTTGSESSPPFPGLCAQSPSPRNRENSIPGTWNPLGPPHRGRYLQRGLRGNFDGEAPPSPDAEPSARGQSDP